MILQIGGVGLVRLNLGAKEAVVLDREFKLGSPYLLLRLCLYETDLPSLLQAMKPFVSIAPDTPAVDSEAEDARADGGTGRPVRSKAKSARYYGPEWEHA